MITNTDWSEDEEDYSKKLSPEKARQQNNNYVKTSNYDRWHKMKDPYKHSTVEAVKKFDFKNSHAA